MFCQTYPRQSCLLLSKILCKPVVNKQRYIHQIIKIATDLSQKSLCIVYSKEMPDKLVPCFLVICRELISDNSLLIFVPSKKIFLRRELFFNPKE